MSVRSAPYTHAGLARLAKQVGTDLGFYGEAGGWIYQETQYSRRRPTRCQGWYKFGSRMIRQGFIERYQDDNGKTRVRETERAIAAIEAR